MIKCQCVKAVQRREKGPKEGVLALFLNVSLHALRGIDGDTDAAGFPVNK